MKKLNPIIKIKNIATENSIRLGENVTARTANAANFLTVVADVFLFIREYHKRNIFQGL